MSYRRCDKCRSWLGCQGYNWYQPYEIEDNGCRQQLIWIITNLDGLARGEYPPDPQGSGYVGDNKPIFRSGGKFHTARDIYDEYNPRLERAGEDGETLIHEVHQGLGLNELAKAARNALNYCAGYKRKKRRYGIWLSTRTYRLARKSVK